MTKQRNPLLDLSGAAQAALIASARDHGRVSGFTHQFYKYPARFSPSFVRAAIEAFSKPGDLVLDNHVGGGTTLVEALALGRNAIGIDISTLAKFVATAKTLVFTDREIFQLTNWAQQVATAVHIRKASKTLATHAELGYYKHLDHPDRWRLRKAIEQSVASALQLQSDRLRTFGRCVVLRTAQWALDGRKKVPSLDEFRIKLAENAKDMVHGADQLSRSVHLHPSKPTVRVFNRTAVGLEKDRRIKRAAVPKLILTSPPYPGVHVLYHRWQVDGRKEAPLPFMIANTLDGAGASYYTMGDRKSPSLKTYFDSIRGTMSSAAALANADTTIVQMVAFSEPQWQMTRYLEAMREAGLIEVFLPSLSREGDGRLWRRVPGRRWYSEQRGHTPGSHEVVLLHRQMPTNATECLRAPMPPSEASSAM